MISGGKIDGDPWLEETTRLRLNSSGKNLNPVYSQRSSEVKGVAIATKRQRSMKMKTLETPAPTIDTLADRLRGLPGSLNIDEKTTGNYFGHNARLNFFDRQRWLHRQRDISENENTHLTFDDPPDANSTIPFAPVRRPKTAYVDLGLDDDLLERSLLLRPVTAPAKLRQGAAESELSSWSTKDIEQASPFDDIDKSSPSGKDAASGEHPLRHGGDSGSDDFFFTSLQHSSATVAHTIDGVLPLTLSHIAGARSQHRGRLLHDTDQHDDGDDESTIMFLGTEFEEFERMADTVASPRTKYISRCLDEKLNPRPSLIIRRNLTKKLALQHQGFGDRMGVILAESLHNLPYVESVNISDNKLTDVGLVPLLSAVLKFEHLLELNISKNEIGPGTASLLEECIRNASCSIIRLTMVEADIDDFECTEFVKSMRKNKSIRELSLGKNLIGKAESLFNVSRSNAISGAESLAQLLQSSECLIATLRLDWNFIRLNSAVKLMESLELNNSLTYLDLSYNGLGREGGLALGKSLLTNAVLETLLIRSNSIDSVACVTICAGITQHPRLKTVTLDGNPIGEQGIRAVMLTPMLTLTGKTMVSVKDCNTNIHEGSTRAAGGTSVPASQFKLDLDRVAGSYELDMSQPYDRAVMFLLLQIVANHSTYLFDCVEHEVPGSKNKATKKTALSISFVTVEKPLSHLTGNEIAACNNLREVLSIRDNVKKTQEIFNSFDSQGFGYLEKADVMKLLKALGMKVSEALAAEVIDTFSADSSGMLAVDDFMQFIESQRDATQQRLYNICNMPTAVLAKEPAERFCPPEVGKLRFTIFDGFARKSVYRMMTAHDFDYLFLIANSNEFSGSMKLDVVSHGISSALLELEEANALMQALLDDPRDKIDVLKRILPRIATAEDARELVLSTLTCHADRKRLKDQLGNAYRPLYADPNGYYFLDLGKEMDRVCLWRLLEISKTVAIAKWEATRLEGTGVLGDFSQKRNWSCFRNEMLDFRPFIITDAFASTLPKTGKLEFDFILYDRSSHCRYHDMDDERFLRLLESKEFINTRQAAFALSWLLVHKRMGHFGVASSGYNMYEVSRERSTAIRMFKDRIYASLPLRSTMIKYNRVSDSCMYPRKSAAVEEHDAVLPLPREVLALLPPFEESYTAHYEPSENDIIPVGHWKRWCTEPYPSKFIEELREEDLALAYPTDAKALALSGRERRKSVKVYQEAKIFADVFDEIPLELLHSRSEAWVRLSELRDSGVKSNVGGAFSDNVDDGPSHYYALRSSAKPSVAFNSLATTTTSSKPTTAHLQARKGDKEKAINNTAAGATTLAAGRLGNESKLGDSATQEDEEGSPRIRWEDPSAAVVDDNDDTDGEKNDDSPVRPARIILEDVMPGRYASFEFNEQLDFVNPKDIERVMSSTSISVSAKYRLFIGVLQEVFAKVLLRCRYVAFLIGLFSKFGNKNSLRNFGTFNVELIISVFNRIADIHNFEIILKQLTSFEIACLYCRVGHLNLYNPCKPEGWHYLDVSIPEERIVVKTLCVLAQYEPGDNWLDYSFRRARAQDIVPGWTLTASWLTEKGLSTAGIVQVKYFSGDAVGLLGCSPVVPFRRSLLNMVLADEAGIIKEIGEIKPFDLEKLSMKLPLTFIGEKHMKNNIELWRTYLVGKGAARMDLVVPVLPTSEIVVFNDTAKDKDENTKGKGKLKGKKIKKSKK